MLNLAYSLDSNTPLESAILNRKNYNKEYTKNISLMNKDVEADSDYSTIFDGTVKELMDFMNDKESVDESFEYPRYWHGYLIILKPLLLIMNYNQIRYLMFILIIILLTMLTILIYKNCNIWYALSLIFSVLITDFLISSICINTSICFLISLIASIYIICKKDKIKNIYLIFFFIGILTNLFDLLTNPILTLCFPMITYFMVNKKKDNELMQLILIAANWGIGYLGIWVTKWIITDMLFNRNVIKNAILQVLYRTSGESIGFTILIQRLITFSGTHTFLLIFLLICFYLVLILINRKNEENKTNIIYILISLIPLIWFIVLKNHSAVHAFFAYRNFSVVIYSLLVGILMMNNILCKEKEKTCHV